MASRLPPETDGVGDHAHRVASELHEAGHDVVMIANGSTVPEAVYALRSIGGKWTLPATVRAVVALMSRRRGRLIVEYTPHLYGTWTVAPVAVTLAARMLRMPATIVVHESFHPPLGRGLIPAMKAALFGFRDYVSLKIATDLVVASAGRLRTLRSRAPALAGRTRVVPIGANLEPSAEFSTARLRTVRDDRIEIVTFGVVMPRRRLELIVEALAAIRVRGLDARLTIVGRVADANYERRVRAATALAGLDAFVAFTGTVSPQEIETIFARAGIAVFAAVEGAIGSSGALLALLAFGIPTVAAMTEHDDERFGAVTERVAADPRAIAEAVIRLHRDEAARTALAQRAFSLYAGQFSWSSIAARLADGSRNADEERDATCAQSS